MIRYRLAVAIAALVAAAAGSGNWNACCAKEVEKPKQTTSGVAVLDVTRIFKESKRFRAEMEKMKADVKKAEENVKRDQEKLKAQRDEIEKLPAGSDERLKQEEEQNKLEAALQASVALQKKTFISREARIYFTNYQQMEAEAAAYAKEHGIDMVIRINGDRADVSNPQSVLQYINRPMVWVSPKADITLIIQERLDNRKDSANEKAE